MHALIQLRDLPEEEIDVICAKSRIIHTIADPMELDAFLSHLQPYGILQVQRSSPVFVEKLQPSFNPYQSSHLMQYQAFELSTQQIHTDSSGKYTKERLVLHARIADQLYAGVSENLITRDSRKWQKHDIKRVRREVQVRRVCEF